VFINIVSGDGTVPEQRNAQDVHATGPAPWPQHSRRRDHVQRDRVWPRGRSVPQPDQDRITGHYRLPVVRFFGVSRTVHSRTATETGKSITNRKDLETPIWLRRFCSLKIIFVQHNIVWPSHDSDHIRLPLTNHRYRISVFHIYFKDTILFEK